MCWPLDSTIKTDNGKPKEQLGFTVSKTLSLMMILKKKVIQVIYKNVRSHITECSLLLLFLKVGLCDRLIQTTFKQSTQLFPDIIRNTFEVTNFYSKAFKT